MKVKQQRSIEAHGNSDIVNFITFPNAPINTRKREYGASINHMIDQIVLVIAKILYIIVPINSVYVILNVPISYILIENVWGCFVLEYLIKSIESCV